MVLFSLPNKNCRIPADVCQNTQWIICNKKNIVSTHVCHNSWLFQIGYISATSNSLVHIITSRFACVYLFNCTHCTAVKFHKNNVLGILRKMYIY